MEDKSKKSKLKVNEGIEQPSSMNEEAVERIRARKSETLSPGAMLEGILKSDRSILGRAITLIESSLPEHQQKARELITACLPHSGKSIRIGITGVPGVGKSTFIEAFGRFLTSRGHRVAVLAIDPSSQRSKGSILGDKTRMEQLSADPNAFIRPSPSAGTLGGVARMTRESITLCEAAGFDVIIVETVGVGQSETAVHSMVDFFLLLMLAGAGDELQGIKRGIMELSDALVINKADGDNLKKAELARNIYENALHLFPAPPSGWTPVSRTCSSTEGNGIPEIWQLVNEYKALTMGNGYFQMHRKEQLRQRLSDAVSDQLHDTFFAREDLKAVYREMEARVLAGELSPYAAAAEMMAAYLGKA